MASRVCSAAFLLMSGLVSTATLAATSEEFETAYATAVAHDKEAAAAKNRWPSTEAALKKARTAADAHDYDQAVALAKEADALAQASLFQSKNEETAWRDAVIP